MSLEVCKNVFWMLRETCVETRGWELNLTSSSVLLLTCQFRTSFMPASGSGSAGGVKPVQVGADPLHVLVGSRPEQLSSHWAKSSPSVSVHLFSVLLTMFFVSALDYFEVENNKNGNI